MITEKKWEERIRDPHAECMSEEERRILQGEKLRKLVKRVYGTVPFYTEKMKELGVEPGDIKSIEDITKLHLRRKTICGTIIHLDSLRCLMSRS